MGISVRTGSFSWDIRMSSKERKFSSWPSAPDSTRKYASDMAAARAAWLPLVTDAIAIVGIAKMNATVISHEEYPVNTIIIHEGFDNETMTNNLALLKTDTAMRFSSLVESICFLRNQQYTPLASRNCWVAGWNPTFAVNAFLPLEAAVCDLGGPL